MSYFPKYYTKTNLYTIGNEYVIKSTGENYIGYYWSTGNNRFYSGKNPQDSFVTQIIPIPPNQGLPNQLSGIVYVNYVIPTEGIQDSTPEFPYNKEIVLNYLNIFNPNYPITNNTKMIPPYNLTIPTQQDYQNGEFRRYFAKKTNAIEYIEINQLTYDALVKKIPTIEWTLYFPFNIPWKLTGDKQQVYDVNRNITLLKMKNNKLYKFDEYLKFDFIKYYKYTELSNLYTSGGEFKTANGQNYIGDYHVHDSKGPMVGKTHTVEPHGYLFPINEAISPRAINQQTNIKQSQSTSSYNPTPMNMGGGYSGGGGGSY